MFWKKKKTEKKTEEVDRLRIFMKGGHGISYDFEHPVEGKKASVLNFHKGFFKWYFNKSSDKFIFRIRNGEVVIIRDDIALVECTRREVPCEDSI